MNVDIQSRNVTTLSQEILQLFKAHARIFHSDEDVLLLQYLSGAIEQIEQATGMLIFPTTAIITAETDDWTDKGLKLPSPVNSWSMADTTGYALKSSGFLAVVISYLTGTAANVAITINCGYASAAAMPPSLVQAILKATSNLNEYRDIYTPNDVQMKPDWWNDAMAGFWNPEV